MIDKNVTSAIENYLTQLEQEQIRRECDVRNKCAVIREQTKDVINRIFFMSEKEDMLRYFVKAVGGLPIAYFNREDDFKRFNLEFRMNWVDRNGLYFSWRHPENESTEILFGEDGWRDSNFQRDLYLIMELPVSPVDLTPRAAIYQAEIMTPAILDDLVNRALAHHLKVPYKTPNQEILKPEYRG